MSDIQVLTYGSNPNLSFYAWRLQETKSCQVTVVNETLTDGHADTMIFNSNIFGNDHVFKPKQMLNNIKRLDPEFKFDIIFISCNSLQDFQTISNNLVDILNYNSTIIIESTGYINLEPFLKLNFENWHDLSIISIMNETEVKQLPNSNIYHHKLINNDNRIYIGSSIEYANYNLNNHPNFIKILKLFQLVSEDSDNKIVLLKSILPKEFMTYQWKLALSRIVFGPLLIIFELDYPRKLSDQILCKPLITGILNELLKIIKKMDCKLVKGYENEQNLFQYWSNLYSESNDKYHHGPQVDYLNSPTLFYNYYYQFNLEIDLLLLQPILLGDDNSVRTPYLENLYSMMCQLIKINDIDSRSIFFQRKSLVDNNNNVNSIYNNNGNKEFNHHEYNEKLIKFDNLNNDILGLETKLNDLNSIITQQEGYLKNLKFQISDSNVAFETLNNNLTKQQEKFDVEQNNYQKLLSEFDNLKLKHQEQEAKVISNNNQVPQHNSQNNLQQSRNKSQQFQPIINSKSNKSLVSPGMKNSISNDNLEDLTDIAVYGAEINGENIRDKNFELQQRELELKKREQDLLQREQSIKSQATQPSNQPSASAQVPQPMQQQIQPPPPQGQIQEQGQQNYPIQGPAGPQGQAPLKISPQNGHPSMNMNMPMMNNMNGMPMNGMSMNGMPMNGMNGMNGMNMNQIPMMNGMQMNGMQMNGMNMNGMNGMNNMNGMNGMNSMNNMNMNGMNMNGMHNGMNNMNPMMYNQRNSNRYSRSRLNSLQSSNYFDQQINQNGMNQNGMNQPGMNQPGMNPNSTAPAPSNGPQRRNRRSQFPMNDLALDMGGRGGMPMPNGPGPSKRKSSSGIPIIFDESDNQGNHPGSHQGTQGNAMNQINQGNHQSAMNGKHKSLTPANLVDHHLKPPPMNESSSNSSRSSDGPTTIKSNDHETPVSLPVPLPVPTQQPKPMAEVNDKEKEKKKKKKGLFR